MNTWIRYGLTGALLYGIIRLIQMKNVSDMVTVRLLKPRVHKIDLSGLVLYTEVAINNPTRDTVRITKPVVTLTSKGQLLAQSRSENRSYLIEPLALTQIDTIQVLLPWTVVATLVGGMVSRIPEIIAAGRREGDVTSNVLRAIGIPLELSFSTYANGLFFQSPSEKLL